MIQDLFPQDNSGNFQAAPSTIPPTFSQGFSSAWEANSRFSGLMAGEQNQYDFIQRHLDNYNQKTGQSLSNPMGVNDEFRPQRMQALRDQTAAKAKELNDPSLVLPGNDDIAKGGVMLARAAMGRSAQVAAQGGLAGSFGSGTAGLVGMATDPVNLLAMAAAPEGGTVLAAALKTGGAMAAQTALTEAATIGYKRQVNPEYGITDAAAAIMEAGVGGALFGAGGKLGAGSNAIGHSLGAAAGGALGGGAFGYVHNGQSGMVEGALAGAAIPLAGAGLGAVWRRLRLNSPDIAAHVPQAVSDAGNVVERAADLEANNPFRTGDGAAGAHVQAIAATERALQNDKPVEMPDAAVQEAGARTGQAFVGKQAIGLKYELAEANDLVTSHDSDFRVNPAYPAEMQPRDRAGMPARDQVMSIAQNLQPERLGPNPEANAGAPIVGPDNVVESGNGRAMAVRAAYSYGDERSGAYRAWLERSGYDTTQFENPVLVGRRVTPMTPEERASFAHAANGSASLRMSATEQAMSDARHMGEDVTSLHRGGDVNSAANRDFVRSVVAKMPAGERGGMMTANGELSAAGVKRINAALVARAFGDPDVIARAFDHADPNIKTIASAMVDSALPWAKMREAVTRGDIPSGHDITADVMQAVKTIMRQRDIGRPVWEGFAQGDAFQSDTSELASRLFFKDDARQRFLSKKDIAENLSTFAHDVGKGVDLFNATPATAKDALSRTIAKSDATVAAQIREAGTEKNAELAFADPKVREAAEANLRRSIDQGRNQVPVEDGNGGWRMSVADAELHDLDNQLKMADEVKACSIIAPETDVA